MEKIVQHGPGLISISVVSHGQIDLIAALMQDIQTHCQAWPVELILTLNIDEKTGFDAAGYSFPVRVIRNAVPLGFGANHNQAFKAARGNYFCIVNPDIRFDACPLAELLACLEKTGAGVAAPLVVGPSGQIEDSVRRFPTPRKIIAKVFSKIRVADYTLQDRLVFADWVGGMFMLFDGQVFADLQGFDERFFLYYEDVDLCARLNLSGLPVVACTGCRVIHHAQRSSHGNLKYLRWHLGSMLRFFLSPVYWRLKRLGRL